MEGSLWVWFVWLLYTTTKFEGTNMVSNLRNCSSWCLFKHLPVHHTWPQLKCSVQSLSAFVLWEIAIHQIHFQVWLWFVKCFNKIVIIIFDNYNNHFFVLFFKLLSVRYNAIFANQFRPNIKQPITNFKSPMGWINTGHYFISNSINCKL